jgi:hypothetical protein
MVYVFFWLSQPQLNRFRTTAAISYPGSQNLNGVSLTLLVERASRGQQAAGLNEGFGVSGQQRSDEGTGHNWIIPLPSWWCNQGAASKVQYGQDWLEVKKGLAHAAVARIVF